MDGLKLSPFLAAIGVAALSFYGCGSPVKSEKSLTPPFTIPSGEWVDPTNPEDNEDPSEAAGFFVKVKSSTATVTTHRADTSYGGTTNTALDYTGNFSTECRIPVGTSAIADRDILCYAEIEELDAFFSELEIQYHFPPSMCSYAKFTPYFFYAWEPGRGETTLNLELDTDGTIMLATPAAAFSGSTPTCIYDHTDNDGPNCCIGSYTLTTLQHNATPPDSTTTTEGEWGGSVGNCLSGPGTSASHSGYISANGIPMTKVKYVEGAGLNDTFKILAPIDSSFNGYYLHSNLWTANYYRNGDYLPGDDRPLGLRQPATAGGLPSDTYKFECHNRAEELQYRIRLMVREWNTDPISEGGDPDFDDGTGDPNDPDPVPGPLNDRLDWLDIGANYPETDI